ncbi:hypothetical protein U9M48_010973 [Paspalum notatum var. saurae]|uniref:Uncharacterized protein n=1 Tax=Paspalum notatum var. saurae TaxID=547442 RepID=A0AAQ3WGN3_PASNO
MTYVQQQRTTNKAYYELNKGLFMLREESKDFLKDCTGGSGSRGYVAPRFGAEPRARHIARLGNGRGRGTMAAVVAGHSEGDGAGSEEFAWRREEL